MFESKSGILLIAGILCFALAFLGNAIVPILMYRHLREKTVWEMVHDDPNVHRNMRFQLNDLRKRYPEAFKQHVGNVTEDDAEAEVDAITNLVKEGRKIYVGEGCWHCHSQFIRPVSNEAKRWGPVSKSVEYQNELQRPVMFGTRRVGPDLIREGGRQGNAWHVVHFYKPKMTSPESVMPDYPWFFQNNKPNGPGEPNRKGFAIILYMQFLGSWLPDYHDHYGTIRSGSEMGGTP